MSSPLYTKALIIGATSGIGESLAARLVSQGTKVIAVGRRQERLDRLVSLHGQDKVSTVAFDILQLSEMPNFASSIAQEHPDLDCIILNSGIQRAFDFTKPETVDLTQLDEETTTNYISYVHLTKAFLPLLQNQDIQTHLIYISATLGIIPGVLRTLNYNATKAALHNFIMALREQLKAKPGNNVKIIEVFPPAVQTELHDERHQPDLKDGGAIGMPLEDFTTEMIEGLVAGEEQFGVGHAKATLGGFEKDRQNAFHAMIKMVSAGFEKHLK